MQEGPDTSKPNVAEILKNIPERFQPYLRNFTNTSLVDVEDDDGFILSWYVNGFFGHNDKSLPAQIHFETSEGEETLVEKLTVKVGDLDGGVRLTADVEILKNKQIADTTIMRIHGEMYKPPLDLGLHLYETVFSYLESIGQYAPRPFVHKVEKRDYGHVKMKTENWQRKFHPILIKHNYVQIDEVGLVWEKTYGSESITT